jgi:hypothetical protein
MIPNRKFSNLDLDFWANVKLLSQRLGYTVKQKEGASNVLMVPSIEQVQKVFKAESLDVSKLVSNNQWTSFGQLVYDYFEYRKSILEKDVQKLLMNQGGAKALFQCLKSKQSYDCPMPMNKQKGDKKDFAYLTCICNMLIESNLQGLQCDYDPKELTSITKNNFPVRTMSRRVDGAFPSPINPIAIWEIKEYYYTTTFGSRVADGVYETQLDGLELFEIKEHLDINVEHYLIIDDHNTWWNMGKSYLCRLIDIMHMGLVTEVLFGREVLDRLPAIVQNWVTIYRTKQP